jgi:hypothetical protein
MEVALQKNVHSLAIPCLGTGFYGFPMLEAAKVAIQTISDFLGQHLSWRIKVFFFVFNDVERTIYAKLMRGAFKPWAAIQKKRISGNVLEKDQRVVVLIIDQNAQNQWYEWMKNTVINGQKVLVEQTAWSSIRSCVASVSKGLILDLGPTPNAAFGTSMGQSRSVAPHVVLVRNFAKGAKNDEYRVRKKEKEKRRKCVFLNKMYRIICLPCHIVASRV